MKLNKYRAVKTGGYDSRKEARRAQELRLMEASGEITNLVEQVKFELIPKQDGERAVHYIADFCYVERGVYTVEDVKSPITRKNPAYIIKRKLMLYMHGMRIKET